MGFLDKVIGALPIVNAVTNIAGSLSNRHEQRRTNAQNLAMQREQLAWEENMSNTAIQRRADDIEKAGGNRALAFTNGSEASTPVLAPARNEAPRFDSPNLGQVALLKAQIDNINEDTRGKRIKNNVDNAFAWNIAALNQDLKTIAKQKGEKQYDLLKQQINNAVQAEINAQIQAQGYQISNARQAAELEQFKRTTEAIVQLAIQQARAGQLDLDALENIANVGGVEAGKMQGVIKTVLDAVRVFTMENRR